MGQADQHQSDGNGDYNGDEAGLGGAANGYGFGIFGNGGNTSGDCLTGLYEAVAWINTGWCSFNAGQWYHLVETNSAGTVTFYVNGTQVYSAPTGVTPNAPLGGMMIGGYNATLASYSGPTTRFFHGQISNAAFYPSALTSTQAQAHFAARTGQASYTQAVTANSPNAYYELNEPAQINEYPVPAGGTNPQGITSGPDGNVWFTDAVIGAGTQVNELVKVSPASSVSTGTLSATEYATPTNGWGIQRITAGSDGAMWFTENGTNQVGRITLGGYTLRDLAGDATTFTAAGSSGLYVPTLLTKPGGANQTTVTYASIGGQAVPKYAITAAPTVPAQNCITNPAAGCRMLTFNYAAATGGQTTNCSAGNSGTNYLNQLDEIDFTAWDPSLNGGAGAMRGLPGQTSPNPAVACYLYAANGYLKGEWDPRTIGSGNTNGLETSYAYNATNELTSLTPPGLNPWTFNYFSSSSGPQSPFGTADPNYTGSLASVSRTLGSTTSTATVVYNVPASGTGAPYALDSATTGNWGETDAPTPTGGTAIFPPDEVPPGGVPSDYNHATVHYVDAAGNEVNVASPPSRVAEFTSGLPAATTPSGVAAGADGNVWVADPGGHAIEKITPAGAITPYTSGLPSGSKPTSIAAGPDGNVWFTDAASHAVGKITTAGTITEYTTGLLSGSTPTAIAAGPGDNGSASVLWFTDPGAHALGEINTSGVITEHTSDIGLTSANSPYGVTEGRDGNIWFTDSQTHQIGHLNISGMSAYETGNGLSSGATPTAITTGADGNLWFTDPANDAIGKISPTGPNPAATEYTIPTSSSNPAAITAGPDGNTWFVEQAAGAGKVAKITPSGTITEYAIPTASSQPAGIAPGADGALWFSENPAGKIGRITTTGVNGQGWISTTQYGYNPTSATACPGSGNPPDPSSCATSPTANDAILSLAPNNRLEALANSNPAAQAGLLDTLSYYSSDGTELQRTIGPQHNVILPGSNTPQPARADTTDTYNCANDSNGVNSCNGASAPTDGGPYALLTESQAGALPASAYTTSTNWAQPPAATNDIDIRASTTSYTSSTQNNLGWTLRAPLAVTVDPAFIHSGGLNLTSTTFYDPTTAQPIETVQPKDSNPSGPSPANGISNDSSATQTFYYTAGTSPSVPSYCQSTPQFAGLACQTQPATQPSDAASNGVAGSLPSLPVTGGGSSSSGINAGVKYNVWNEPLTTAQSVWNTAGGQNTRTTTATYDAAGRPSSSQIQATGTGAGVALPQVSDTYYPTTGLPQTQSTTSGSTTNSITSSYDNFGRLATYASAVNATATNTATYCYDQDSRLIATFDSKQSATSCPTGGSTAGMTSYTYDPNSGAMSSVTDASGISFYGAYDANGNLAGETYPNGMTATTAYDETATPTSKSYLKFSGCVSACTWFSDQAPSTIHGQWASQTSSLSSQSYTYDQAGRLTNVQDTVTGGRQLQAMALPTGSAGPTSMITGPDGNLWLAENWAGKIAKITPAGAITEYPTPGQNPMDLTVGPDGNLWFANASGNAIAKITTSGTVTTYPLPHPNSYPTSIAPGAGNTLVYTDYWTGKVGVITTSGTITEYQPPTAAASPANIVKGSDGNDYFVEYNPTTHVEQIGEFNTSTNTITETALKTGSAPDQTWSSGPGEAAAGQGVIWFVDDGNQQLAEYNISTKTTTYFAFPADTTAVAGLALATDGTLWFTEQWTGKVGRLYPATNSSVEYQTNPGTTGSTGITQGPAGNIWLADQTTNEVYTLAGGGACTTRQYGFDADTNRTSLNTITAPTTTCPTSGGTTQTYPYDNADRLTASGVPFDPFGRITGLPAGLADPNNQNPLATAYYVNDRIQQLNQANQQISYTLDPALRILQRTTVASGSTTYENSYYDGPSDSPAWTQNVNSGGQPTGTWTRNIVGIGGALAAIQTNTATTLQLNDLHGSVVATASLNATASGPLTACDATEYGVPRSGTGACSSSSRYSWLGGKTRPTELASGVIAMGQRGYAPMIGAFLQTDPIAGGGANAYGYTSGDPINAVDLGGTSVGGPGCRKVNGHTSCPGGGGSDIFSVAWNAVAGISGNTWRQVLSVTSTAVFDGICAADWLACGPAMAANAGIQSAITAWGPGSTTQKVATISATVSLGLFGWGFGSVTGQAFEQTAARFTSRSLLQYGIHTPVAVRWGISAANGALDITLSWAETKAR